jgi:hypothetical protein
MRENSRVYQFCESGLSKVIGFVLIIGLIVVVASLYLSYGVPAQGRDNEIVHMNEIKDQFVGYKLILDSLFNNNKVGTTVSNSFTLGTVGGYSLRFPPSISAVFKKQESIVSVIQENTPKSGSVSFVPSPL